MDNIPPKLSTQSATLVNNPMLAALHAHPQWVVYKLMLPHKKKDGTWGWDKIPVNPLTLKNVGHNKQNEWMTVKKAIALAQSLCLEQGDIFGVGFSITPNIPIVCIDLDKCFNPDNSLKPFAIDILNRFRGAFVERSVSGTGLHIWFCVTGVKPRSCSITLPDGISKVEVFTCGRFVAMTGVPFEGWNSPEDSSSRDFTKMFTAFMADYFTKAKATKQGIVPPPPTALSSPLLTPEVIADLRSALKYITAVPDSMGKIINLFDDRDIWIAIGYALSELGELGFELWKEFSETSVEHNPDRDLVKWGEFKANSTGYKAVFQRAYDHGWEGNKTDPKTVGFGISPLPVGASLTPIYPVTLGVNPQIPSLAEFGWKKVSVGDLFTNPEPPIRFLIDEIIPAGAVTGLSAHGGMGKSTWGLQAGISVATGKSLVGKTAIKGKALYCDMEDGGKVNRRRLANICRSQRIDPSSLVDCFEMFDARTTPFLFRESKKGGGKLTETYFALLEYLKSHHFDFVIIDNASNTFAANENDRAVVTEFILALSQLVESSGGAVLLLQHVNKRNAEGDDSLEGSGSTAWHNAVRSRLIMKQDKNNGIVTITHAKSNYGKLSDPMKFIRLQDGVLIPELDNPKQKQIQDETEYQANLNLILRLIDKYDKQGNCVFTGIDKRPNAFKRMKNDKLFPKSIRNESQLYELLYRAEGEKWLERKEYYNEQNNKKEKYQLTQKSRDVLVSVTPM